MRPEQQEGEQTHAPIRPRAPTGLWLPFETEEFEYGTLINAVENPEIISATSVDRLQSEQMKVQASEQCIKRLTAMLDHINANEKVDPLVSIQPGKYPIKPGRCCAFFKAKSG